MTAGTAELCGRAAWGLDNVPPPGRHQHGKPGRILLDVAMLASRLGKPLTARLMPLPGLAAGDPVTFDFPYFAPSRVMTVSDGVTGLMSDGNGRPLPDIQKN
ncbi:MAG: DUF711 family protein [Ardenticatenaceae bacterium]|nr:DUF711 family protein [Ardenticatenaceae bacterium]